MIDVIVSKRCARCHQVKAMGEYRVDLTTKDGRKHACSVCLRAAYNARYKAKRADGVKRDRTPVVRMEPLWPLPTYTLTDSLDCIRLRKWRGPVSHEPMRARL